MAGVTLFRYRPRNSFLNRCNPLSKLLFLILFCITVGRAPLPLCAAFAVFLLLVMAAIRLPLAHYRSDVAFFGCMGLLLWACNGRNAQGWLLALRFLLCILLSLVYGDTTDLDDLAGALGALLDRIPFVHGWALASTISLTVSLVPMLFETVDRIRDAQRSRCGGGRHPLRSLITFVTALFATLFAGLASYSDSLDARLFDPDRARRAPSFGWRDLVVAGLAGVVALC